MVLGVSWTDLVTAVASIIALGVSTLAIIQTKNQSKITNKQFLFTKRTRAFFILQELQACFDIYRRSINSKEFGQNEEEKKLYLEIELLTNNSFFYDLGNDRTVGLIKKMTELTILSLDIKFYFPKKEVQLVSDFISNYSLYLSMINIKYNKISTGKKENDNEKMMLKSTLLELNENWKALETGETLLRIEKSIKFKN